MHLTWQIWEDNALDCDSTLGFAEKEGFRCGTCCEYSVFNILTRKKLGLKERPLIVMESTFIDYQDISPEVVEAKIKSLVDTVKKYRGYFVLLWHNSRINSPSGNKYWKVYKKILAYAGR